MATRKQSAASEPAASADQNATALPSADEVTAYWNDAMQRTYLFLDTLLDRGNNYLEHLDQGTPPLLKFEHEVVMDGHDLPNPCNYALLRLQPPASMPVKADA